MKKLILLICVLCWSYNTNSQCDDTLPVMETFDTNTIGVCWEVHSEDADKGTAYDWYWREYLPVYGGYKCLVSRSYNTADGALTPDNWVVSYPIDLTSFSTSDNIQLSWKVRGEYASLSHEYYSVYAATGKNTSDFTNSSIVTSEYADEVGGTGTFVTRTMNISALAGNMIYIAFRHYNSTDQYSINIDDVAISSGGTSGGCNSDSDNDGICDPNDQCPELNNALIGTACNDGNPCTINDVYTSSNCGCTGTYADSDNDGVCNYYDTCPGFDDNIDVNRNGIPDGCEETSSCTEDTVNFPNSPLMHSGSGSKSTTLILPSGSQNISFTINNIDDKLKGKQSSYYIERILVTYKDAAGVTKTKGTYSGDQVSSATVNIPDNAQSITIKLDDAYDGNSDSTMSVSLSPVTYCSTSSPNPSPCTDSYGNFSKNPLTNPGTGSSSTTLSLPTNSQDASFSISGLDSKTKGKQGSLYIENVVVTYIDGSGVLKTYGTYNGANVSSATINITGKVKSITISLSTFSGTTDSTLSVDLSSVTYCISSGTSSSQAQVSTNESVSQQNYETSKINEPLEATFKIYPNPASNTLFIKSMGLNDTKANITLYNINGMQVQSHNLNSKYALTSELDISRMPTGLYILRIVGETGDLLKTERIVIK